jgi:uncharacterized membrane protein YciS (DUF1049 family)
MNNCEISMLIALAVEAGFIFGWLIQDYRYAGKELKRVREDFEETKRRFRL